MVMHFPYPQHVSIGSDVAALMRVRDAAYRCHDLHMDLISAKGVLEEVARGDDAACALLGMRLSASEAEAAAARVRADFALDAKDDDAELLSESSASVSSDAPMAKTVEQRYRQRLLHIYREHNPEKLADLDGLMQKYEGKEAELYRKVCDKYSVLNADYPVAIFDTTEGIFKAEIYLDRVPLTASNFIDLSQNGFYNGIYFHRVIPNFMNQFGCPHARDPNSRRAGTGNAPDGVFRNLQTGAPEQRSGGTIQDEHISKDANRPGTLSMANSGYPNSGGSQFFINLKNNWQLDWFTDGKSQHVVFGKVIEGYVVCEKISKVDTVTDRPVVPIRMNSVSIVNL